MIISITVLIYSKSRSAKNTIITESARAVAQSLLGEHVRIMQETFVWVSLCKPRAAWNEVGLYLCLNECAVVCWLVLFCFVLFCFVLFCFVLFCFCFVLFGFVWFCLVVFGFGVSVCVCVRVCLGVC